MTELPGSGPRDTPHSHQTCNKCTICTSTALISLECMRWWFETYLCFEQPVNNVNVTAVSLPGVLLY